jgi:hypothetical protein
MLTMADIESLQKQTREAKDLDDMQRLGHAMMLHAPELLARAKAWERVMLDHWKCGDACFVAKAMAEFRAADAKGFQL